MIDTGTERAFGFAQIGAKTVSDTQRLDKAMDLLARAANHIECNAPDKTWWKEYFLLTGQHMILTDDGWEHGSAKSTYEAQAHRDGDEWAPLDEVNEPSIRAFGKCGITDCCAVTNQVNHEYCPSCREIYKKRAHKPPKSEAQ